MSCQDILNNLKNVVSKFRLVSDNDPILASDHNDLVDAAKLTQQYLENCVGKVSVILPCSYLIYVDSASGKVNAVNCLSGSVDFSDVDAATVINNALSKLTNGGKVFIKAGTYTINTTINIPYDGITIEGEGTSTVLVDNIASGHLINVANRKYVGFKSFKVRVGVLKSSGDEIHIEGSGNVVVEDVEVDGNASTAATGSALNITGGSQYVHARNLRIHDITPPPPPGGGGPAYSGVDINGASDIRLDGLHLWQTAGSPLAGKGFGLVIKAGERISVSNSLFENFEAGVYVVPPSGSTVRSLSFVNVESRGNSGDGWAFEGDYNAGSVEDVSIVDGRAINNGGAGFRFSNWYSQRFRLIGLQAFGNGEDGIHIEYGASYDVISPHVMDNNQSGFNYPGIYIGTPEVRVIGGYSYGDILSYGIYLNVKTSAVDNILIEGIDVTGPGGAIFIAGYPNPNTRITNVIGYPTDIVKATGLAPPVGVGGSYGFSVSAFRWTPYIKYFKARINWSGTFGANEVVTVKVEAVYHDGSKAYVEKSATAPGSTWITDDDLLTLMKPNTYITAVNFYAKTNLASTSVKVTVDAYGHT